MNGSQFNGAVPNSSLSPRLQERIKDSSIQKRDSSDDDVANSLALDDSFKVAVKMKSRRVIHSSSDEDSNTPQENISESSKNLGIQKTESSDDMVADIFVVDDSIIRSENEKSTHVIFSSDEESNIPQENISESTINSGIQKTESSDDIVADSLIVDDRIIRSENEKSTHVIFSSDEESNKPQENTKNIDSGAFTEVFSSSCEEASLLQVRDDLFPVQPSQIIILNSDSDPELNFRDPEESWTNLASSTQVPNIDISIQENECEDISPFLHGRHETSDSESDTPLVTLNENEIKEIQRRHHNHMKYPSFEVRTSQTTDRSSITLKRKEELNNEAKRLSHIREKAITQYKELKGKYEVEGKSLPDGGLNLMKSLKIAENNIGITGERLAFVKKKFKTSKVVETLTIEDYPDHSNPGTLDLPSTSKGPVGIEKKALAAENRQKALIEDSLKRLHDAIKDTESTSEIVPSAKLTVCLKPHQVTALSWLVRREEQKYPRGGILADDMGLGKTFSMISLILHSIKSLGDSESEEDYLNDGYGTVTSGGTLVVCPTSVMGQWESEIKSKTRCGSLTHYVYHGKNREQRPSRLGKFDVVITTYSIIQKEASDETYSPLLKLKWLRIILDEAHIIRNAKTVTAKAVFMLKGARRWCLSGTPIQNKIDDLYSVFKFLHVRPFDDFQVFKNWIANNNSAGQHRLNCIMKSIMLRRTKNDLNKAGALGLKEKVISIIKVQLTPEEASLYEELASFSKVIFSKFIALKAQKENLLDHGFPVMQKGKISEENCFIKHPELNRLFGKLSNTHEVGNVHILLLLLRLRQLCCHPSLISKMMEKEDLGMDGATFSEGGNDLALIKQMNRLSLNPEESNSAAVGEDGTHKLLSLKNPLFNKSYKSSKLNLAIQHLQENILPKGDKALIISQFTSVLDLIQVMLKNINVKYFSLTGKTAVINRGPMIDQFNNYAHGPQVLLLSLQAGGTGLNLVGANHILFIDPHWNPQLERQAFDRIYRIGQEKQVFIYKFISEDTVEEQILKLQQNKLLMADSVMAGTANFNSQKLSFEDLKVLFCSSQ